MSKKNQAISGIILEYHSGIVPPPFSHVFRLELNWSDGTLRAKLDLHYTDREELSEEEILDEGFTLSDDYQYDGSLNPVWVKSIEELLQETRYASQVHGEGEITVATKEHTKTSPAKSPTNQEAWQLLAQDLIQAIYETAKKELPLQINFQVVEKEKTDRGSVTLHFSDRNVQLELNGKTSQLNWEYAFQLMKLIFTPDYDYDIAKEKPGTKRGIYLDCGDGLWHELGKGILNIDPEFDAVAQIEEHMRKLTSN
ncbi:hypothetical protein KUV23_01610 [Algoriphagus marincola]|uniref:Uncharacterized protein n=1 Tax=Algoriphagus marincola TaxID=264027 RepID=A0ABS7N0X8_9BACT|nr:hypothetical protein [Algoriphagus marincola]MBY5949645.1 hypothetical protein [Algoriphagus marincola]